MNLNLKMFVVGFFVAMCAGNSRAANPQDNFHLYSLVAPVSLTHGALSTLEGRRFGISVLTNEQVVLWWRAPSAQFRLYDVNELIYAVGTDPGPTLVKDGFLYNLYLGSVNRFDLYNNGSVTQPFIDMGSPVPFSNSLIGADFCISTQGWFYVLGKVNAATSPFKNFVRVFDSNGAFLFEWQVVETLNTNPISQIEFGPGGYLYLSDGSVYDEAGDFLGSDLVVNPLSPSAGAGLSITNTSETDAQWIAEEGLWKFERKESEDNRAYYRTYFYSGGVGEGSLWAPRVPEGFNLVTYSIFDQGQRLVAYLTKTNEGYLGFYYRTYLNDRPGQNPGIPIAAFETIEVRPGQKIFDIVLNVRDPDSTNVTYGVLGRGGSQTYGGYFRLTTLEPESPDGASGVVVPTQQVHIVWNGEGKLGSGSGSVQFEAFVNDGRPLLDFHFVRVPTNISGGGFRISRTAVSEQEATSAWLYLYATEDPDLNFATSGKVYGAQGEFNGQLLFSDPATTDAGVDYLFARCGVVRASTGQVAIAREGATPGKVIGMPSRYPSPKVSEVNSIGFAVPASSGLGWAIKPE